MDVGSGDPNIDPHIHAASTLTTELSPPGPREACGRMDQAEASKRTRGSCSGEVGAVCRNPVRQESCSQKTDRTVVTGGGGRAQGSRASGIPGGARPVHPLATPSTSLPPSCVYWGEGLRVWGGSGEGWRRESRRGRTVGARRPSGRWIRNWGR